MSVAHSASRAISLLALVVAATIILVGGHALASHSPETPRIAVDPACASEGTAEDSYDLEVLGTHFFPRPVPVEVTFAAGSPSPETFQAETDSDGDFVITIEPAGREAGLYRIVAEDDRGHVAETELAVPCPPTTPVVSTTTTTTTQPVTTAAVTTSTTMPAAAPEDEPEEDLAADLLYSGVGLLLGLGAGAYGAWYGRRGG